MVILPSDPLAVHAAKTTSGVETTMDTTINAGGTTANLLPPDFENP